MRWTLPPLACLLFTLPALAADPQPTTVFDPLKVWEFHVSLSKAEFDAMQPPPGGGGFAFGQPPAQPKPRADGREVHMNTFGDRL